VARRDRGLHGRGGHRDRVHVRDEPATAAVDEGRLAVRTEGHDDLGAVLDGIIARARLVGLDKLELTAAVLDDYLELALPVTLGLIHRGEAVVEIDHSLAQVLDEVLIAPLLDLVQVLTPHPGLDLERGLSRELQHPAEDPEGLVGVGLALVRRQSVTNSDPNVAGPIAALVETRLHGRVGQEPQFVDPTQRHSTAEATVDDHLVGHAHDDLAPETHDCLDRGHAQRVNEAAGQDGQPIGLTLSEPLGQCGVLLEDLGRVLPNLGLDEPDEVVVCGQAPGQRVTQELDPHLTAEVSDVRILGLEPRLHELGELLALPAGRLEDLDPGEARGQVILLALEVHDDPLDESGLGVVLESGREGQRPAGVPRSVIIVGEDTHDVVGDGGGGDGVGHEAPLF